MNTTPTTVEIAAVLSLLTSPDSPLVVRVGEILKERGHIHKSQAIREAIATLPEHERQLLDLTRYDDLNPFYDVASDATTVEYRAIRFWEQSARYAISGGQGL